MFKRQMSHELEDLSKKYSFLLRYVFEKTEHYKTQPIYYKQVMSYKKNLQ